MIYNQITSHILQQCGFGVGASVQSGVGSQTGVWAGCQSGPGVEADLGLVTGQSVVVTIQYPTIVFVQGTPTGQHLP